MIFAEIDWSLVNIKDLKKHAGMKVKIDQCTRCDGFGHHPMSDWETLDGRPDRAIQCDICKGSGQVKYTKLTFRAQAISTPYDSKIEVPKQLLKDS